MTAPAHTDRGTPGGTMLNDGHSTKLTFASDPDVEFKEVTLTPPGFDRGEPINTTCMFNGTDRTYHPRKLLDTTQASGTCKYDPAHLSSIRALATQTSDTITVTFPDGVQWSGFGVLRSFTPPEMSEGTLPLADFVIDMLSQDSSGNEEPIVGSGT